MRWKKLNLPVLEEICGSTDARELSRAHWPPWAHDAPQLSRIMAFSRLANVGTTLPSTGYVAALLTERIDPKDAPQIHNYNFYLIAETTDGEYFQSPPICPTNPAHHSSSPSTWFDDIGPPL